MSLAEPAVAPLDSPAQILLERLRNLHRQVFLAWSLAVGRTVVDVLYDGSLERYHDPSRSKDDPLGRLLVDHHAELTELSLSEASIRRYVRAYEVHRLLPRDTAERLLLMHLLALAPLPAPGERARLALQAAQDGWSAEELAARVTALLVGSGAPPQGRPRKSPGMKAAAAVGRRLADLEALLPADVEALPLGERVAVRRELEDVLRRGKVLLGRFGG